MKTERKWTSQKPSPLKPGWYFYRFNDTITYPWLWTVTFLMPPVSIGDQATFEGSHTEPVLYSDWNPGGQWSLIEEVSE